MPFLGIRQMTFDIHLASEKRGICFVVLGT
ncbi:hypothetical protein LINGRAHAP2_LOCUS16610 [Linum grandiflorum]